MDARVEIHEAADSVALRLPAPRNPLMLLLIACWLPLWAVGLTATVKAMLTQPAGGAIAVLMLVLWLLGWLGGGLFAGYAFCWMVFGHELVCLDGTALTIQRKVCGLGRSETYRVEHIRALRTVAERPGLYELATSLQLFGFGGGKIAFDYIGLDCQFGAGLEARSADEVCALLKARMSKP